MTAPYPFNVPPLAAERNPPIHPEYYAPSRFNISDIVLGMTTEVTTSVDHNYVIGQVVRLHVPSFFGTYQINGMQANVIGIPDDDKIIIDIDSRAYNAFISSPPYSNTPAQVCAIGDVNSGQINISPSNLNLNVPGSFINIS